MKPVSRAELLDFQTYTDNRDAFRKDVMAAKARRRIHVGDHLTLLFENPLTVRYQVQEMMRLEQMVRENDIQHELDTYNELLGGDGELGCTLLIEIDDEQQRAVLLRRWLGLTAKLYARLPDGTKVRPTFDPRQVGDDRLSSVQYLKFAVGGVTPLAFGVDLDEIASEGVLTAEQRDALSEDLGTR